MISSDVYYRQFLLISSADLKVSLSAAGFPRSSPNGVNLTSILSTFQKCILLVIKQPLQPVRRPKLELEIAKFRKKFQKCN